MLLGTSLAAKATMKTAKHTLSSASWTSRQIHFQGAQDKADSLKDSLDLCDADSEG